MEGGLVERFTETRVLWRLEIFVPAGGDEGDG